MTQRSIIKVFLQNVCVSCLKMWILAKEKRFRCADCFAAAAAIELQSLRDLSMVHRDMQSDRIMTALWRSPRVWLTCLLLVGAIAIPMTGAETIEEDSSETGGVESSEQHQYFDDEFDDEFESGSSGGQVFDPLRRYNLFMFRINDWMYVWIIRPVAKGYACLLPERVRVPIGRALRNLRAPVSAVNAVLQFEFKKAGTELGRFLINSTIGILGLFDSAAKHLKWYPANEDFGLTLGHYGIGSGFPLVLPFLEPSNLRDSIALIPNLLLNPFSYIRNVIFSISVGVADVFNTVSLEYEMIDNLRREALDPYSFFRDAHQQNRDKRIQE
jgi:phospholipid-binding lipoprotein MlaA